MPLPSLSATLTRAGAFDVPTCPTPDGADTRNASLLLPGARSAPGAVAPGAHAGTVHRTPPPAGNPKEHPMPDALWTLPRAAALLGIDSDELDRHIAAGRITTVPGPDGRPAIGAGALCRFDASRRRAG